MIDNQPIHDTVYVTKVIVDTVRGSSKDSMELLTKIDSFYNNSWTKLLWVVTIGFTVIGIIMPVIIQWYQKRELKSNEEKLKAEIKSEIKLGLNELEKKIDSSFKNQIEKVRYESYAVSMHIQALLMQTRNQYKNAIRDYFRAIIRYFKADHPVGIKNAISDIKLCINLCTKSDITDAFDLLNSTIDEAFNELFKLDKKNLYKKDLEEVKDLLIKKSTKG